MNSVTLNEGREDRFFHRYEYDEDQRQIAAYSSTDGEIWHRDQSTEFFDHGHLKRKELGHFKIQGLDFTYNLHSQIIGINLPSVNIIDDPGQDGQSEGANQWFAPDAFAMQINYYLGDFNRTSSNFHTGHDGYQRMLGHEYYDGHISANVWNQPLLF